MSGSYLSYLKNDSDGERRIFACIHGKVKLSSSPDFVSELSSYLSLPSCLIAFATALRQLRVAICPVNRRL